MFGSSKRGPRGCGSVALIVAGVAANACAGNVEQQAADDDQVAGLGSGSPTAAAVPNGTMTPVADTDGSGAQPPSAGGATPSPTSSDPNGSPSPSGGNADPQTDPTATTVAAGTTDSPDPTGIQQEPTDEDVLPPMPDATMGADPPDPEPSTDPETTPEPVPEPVPQPEPEPEPEPVVGMCTDMGGYDNGSVTWYTFDQGTVTPNCSYEISNRNPDSVASVTTGDGRYFGAMNTADYDNAAMCGACVELTRDGGRSVTVTIVDQCPVGSNAKCTPGHIDLSQEAFLQLGQLDEGYLGTGNGGMYGTVSWRYVPCPADGNVSFRLKEPDRRDWNELLVQGHPYPITSVEINGQNATRKDYNYWEPPNGDMGTEPYEIRLTDINGSVIYADVTHGGGELHSDAQFMCQ